MSDFPFPALLNYLMIGAALFALGLLGFLARRNLIVMFLSAEMMLQGASLSLVAFGRFHGNWTGQIFTIAILTVAACEAGLALAIILILFARKDSLDVSLWRELREPGEPDPFDETGEEAEAIEVVAGPESYPLLPVAGLKPAGAPHGREARRE